MLPWMSVPARHLELLNAFADVFCHALTASLVCICDQNGKFSPTNASNQIDFADGCGQQIGHRHQHAVAHGVTCGIVDLLKKIQVNHEDPKRALSALHPFDFMLPIKRMPQQMVTTKMPNRP